MKYRGVDSFPPGFSRQQESGRGQDTCQRTNVPLTPSVSDTVRVGVDRARTNNDQYLPMLSVPDTVAMGVDRAHRSTDANAESDTELN